MKNINTLIPDIYSLLKRKDGWFTEELSDVFAKEASAVVRKQFQGQKEPTLRLSQMGPRCPKALWSSIHTPGEAEPLSPWAEFKYVYGHLIEALVITLAKATGHSVTGEQDELNVDGVIGHRDCVIDGCVVDVKSSSTRSFQKFKEGKIAQDDSFGYLDQLDGYVVGSYDDPLVTVKDRGYLLVVDKQLGHMVLYEHISRPQNIRRRIESYKRIVNLPYPPECECKTETEGVSGNIRLSTVASYNNFKHTCFPGLRTFLYAKGPVYLTKVVRKPDVPEVDRYGNFV